METRLVVAYALIGALIVGGAVAGIVLGRQRARRRRRLRGIKTDEIRSSPQRAG